MDKTEAIKRLDALDAEAKKLRKIIEGKDDLVYDLSKLYVVILEDTPYILVGQECESYYRWHSFKPYWLTEQGLSPNHRTGQRALDYVKEKGDIHVFISGKEGMKFFFEHYKRI